MRKMILTVVMLAVFSFIFVLPIYAGSSGPSYAWHTFYGGTLDDYGDSIAVDGSGNVYVTGYSNTSWNGPSGQTPLNQHSGGSDMFVLKLDSSGAYQWHTFYGCTLDDYGNSIALDGNGNVYVTGSSKASWNGPSGQIPVNAHTFTGASDMFVLKLDSSGAYQWHTFYGYPNIYIDVSGKGIALDGNGNVYVTGSANYPGTNYIGFILKLDSSGAYQWLALYGYDAGSNSIAIDGSGNVYVTGYSNTSWNGPSGEAPLHAYSGEGSDIFVLKMDSSGAYQWHTFYGCYFYDYGFSIALDGNGNVYVTGNSDTSWNGPSDEPPLHAYSTTWGLIFVLKLDSSGAYQWHTFYGYASMESGDSIAVDGSGNVYVTGYSNASWNGSSGEPPLHAYSGSMYDIFILKLNSSGAYQWHTFYGSDTFYFSIIKVDGSGNVYLTGESRASWNGPSGEAPLPCVQRR